MATSPLLEPIASGAMRDCFEHPDDPALCIKVPRGVQGIKVCRREARYVARIVRRYSTADMARVPRYVGRVSTDRGPGWVQQRIVNRDGTPAPVLGGCLDAMRHEPRRPVWDAALAEFGRWATTQPLQLRDLTPNNLCVRTLPCGALQFVPIDGFSPRSMLQRLLPTRRYATARNREQLERFALTDMDRLVRTVERVNGTTSDTPRVPRATRLLVPVGSGTDQGRRQRLTGPASHARQRDDTPKLSR